MTQPQPEYDLSAMSAEIAALAGGDPELTAGRLDTILERLAGAHEAVQRQLSADPAPGRD